MQDFGNDSKASTHEATRNTASFLWKPRETIQVSDAYGSRFATGSGRAGGFGAKLDVGNSRWIR